MSDDEQVSEESEGCEAGRDDGHGFVAHLATRSEARSRRARLSARDATPWTSNTGTGTAGGSGVGERKTPYTSPRSSRPSASRWEKAPMVSDGSTETAVGKTLGSAT